MGRLFSVARSSASCVILLTPPAAHNRRVGACDPAVATRRRRDGPATPGCVPDPPIDPPAAAYGESIRRPGTHRAGEPNCPGATGDRRRPAVCPYAAFAPGPRSSGLAPAVGAHDPAVATRQRRDEPATPGCVPGPPIDPPAPAYGESVRRPGTHRAGEPNCPGATGDRRRPAVCPYAAFAPGPRSSGLAPARRGTRPGGGNSAAPRRAGNAGVRARPTNRSARAGKRRVCSSTGHASGRRTRLSRRNRGSPPARRVPLRGGGPIMPRSILRRL